MTRGKTKKESKRLVIITITILALLSYFGASVYRDFIKIKENKQKTELLTSEYEELLEKEKGLVSEVTKMQDPDYLARYAKEKFMYSSEDEIIIRID